MRVGDAGIYRENSRKIMVSFGLNFWLENDHFSSISKELKIALKISLIFHPNPTI
jgi:hypothetical protein